jgi:hypothetical protein
MGGTAISVPYLQHNVFTFVKLIGTNQRSRTRVRSGRSIRASILLLLYKCAKLKSARNFSNTTMWVTTHGCCSGAWRARDRLPPTTRPTEQFAVAQPLPPQWYFTSSFLRHSVPNLGAEPVRASGRRRLLPCTLAHALVVLHDALPTGHETSHNGWTHQGEYIGRWSSVCEGLLRRHSTVPEAFPRAKIAT